MEKGNNAHMEVPMADFSRKTLSILATRGISVYGICVIPSEGDLPFATGVRGYKVSQNGCGKIWTFSQVMKAAE